MNDNKKKWYESLIDGILDFVYKFFVFVSKFLVLVLAVVCGIRAYVNLAEKGYFDNYKSSSTFISASADEATTVADVESGIDLTQYPSANLIQLLDKTATVNGNVVVSSSFDGKVTIKGTATANGGRNSYFSEPVYLEAGKTYSMTYIDGYSGLIYLTLTSDNTVAIGWRSTFTPTVSGEYKLGFGFDKGQTYDLEFYPMLNVGSTLYPFVPNFNAIYNGGYANGYDQGKEDGLDYARAGYWMYCDVHVDIKGTSEGASVSDSFNLSPVITSNGIDLSNVYTEINAKYPNLILSDCSLKLEFTDPIYMDGLQLRCMGDLSVIVDDTLSCVIYDPLTKTFETRRARFALLDGSSMVSGMQIAMTSENEWASLLSKQLVSITSSGVQNISQFKDLRFYSTNTVSGTSYEAGETAGYNAGKKEGYEAGKKEGFALGKKAGKDEGFAEGLNKGLSDDPYGFGDFVYTVLDMPGRLLSNLLNFDFMGVNLAGLVAVIFSLFLAHWVIKKIA